MKKPCVQKNIRFKLLHLICDKISTVKMCMKLIRSSMSVYLKSLKNLLSSHAAHDRLLCCIFRAGRGTTVAWGPNSACFLFL